MLKNFTDQADALGLCQLNLSGGEPLLFTPLDKIFEALQPDKFHLSMSSNGHFLTLEKAKELKKMGLDKIKISLDDFDEAKHDLLVVDEATLNILPRTDQPEPGNTYNWEDKKACAMYRCKNLSLAFKAGWSASGDASCYECSGDPMRYGVNDLGECQQCAKGEIFDGTSKQCKVATVFTKSDMRFGKGKSPSSNLEDQCWIKDNPDCYKCCITNDDTSCSLCSDEE